MNTSDHKKRIKQALHSYCKANQTQILPKPKRRNQKPEQQVVKACMEWMRERGFSMDVVESKAVYSVSSGRYLRGQTTPGFVDAAGCTPEGIGCFIEFKAKGKVSTLRLSQKEFLKQKIYKGCFACVVDSTERLSEIYSNWLDLFKKDRDLSIAYLLKQLPQRRKRATDKGLF